MEMGEWRAWVGVRVKERVLVEGEGFGFLSES